jgi:ribose transport system permease protein
MSKTTTMSASSSTKNSSRTNSGSTKNSGSTEKRTAASRVGSLWGAFARRPEAGALISLVVIGVVLSITTTQFLTIENLTLVARGFAFTAIAGFGAYLVLLSGGIDLSVGSVMGLAGLTAAFLSASGLPAVTALLAGLGAGVGVGFLNGFLSANLGLAPFMVTLGMLSIIRGTDVAITGGVPIVGISPEITHLGQGYALGIPLPVWVMVIIAVALSVVMRRTSFGWYVYSIGGNEEAARLSGVRVRAVKVAVYCVAGFLAAVGGILLVARLGVGETTAGTGYELDVIAAAIIGGTSLKGGQGSVIGVIWGSALLGVVRNGLVLLGVGDFWQTIAIGAVIVAAVVIDRYRSKPTA